MNHAISFAIATAAVVAGIYTVRAIDGFMKPKA